MGGATARRAVVAAVIAIAASVGGTAAWAASWTIETTPTPSVGLQVLGVSCGAAQWCVAVGASSGTNLWVEGWNGTAWKLHAIAEPVSWIDAALLGISCPALDSCWAAGYYDAATRLPLVEHWDGATWARQTVPAPAGMDVVELDSIACVANTATCTAVGTVQPHLGSTIGSTPFVVHSTGSTWKQQTSPSPSGASSASLHGVSCFAATSCWAVGQAFTTATVTLAEHWNGTAWSISSTPNVAGATGSWLSGVSCRAALRCVAVGASLTSASEAPLAVHWNGTAWTIRATPHPPHALLEGVACVTTTDCWAVGSRAPTQSTTATFAAHWNGSSWSAATTPNPNSAALFESVACPSAGGCHAVGYSVPASSTTARALAEWYH